MEEKAKRALHLSEELRHTLYWRSYLELALALVIVFLLWRLWESSRAKGGNSSRRIKIESNEIDY